MGYSRDNEMMRLVSEALYLYPALMVVFTA